MKFRELKPETIFSVPGDYSRSVLRKRWSCWNSAGFNAVFVGGMLAGKATWIPEDSEVTETSQARNKT